MRPVILTSAAQPLYGKGNDELTVRVTSFMAGPWMTPVAQMGLPVILTSWRTPHIAHLGRH